MPTYDSEHTTTSDEDLVKEIRDCFRFAADNDAAQRAREIEDLKFAALDQWPDDIKTARGGQPGGQIVGGVVAMPPTPPRPCLVVDMLGQMIRQVTNQQRNARMAVEIAPKSEGASQKTAELYQGVIRQIEYQSQAQVARSAAFERAVKCGRGYYRVLLGYANDGDFDLDVLIEPILNQANVYLDPTHERPDGSDCKWALVTSSLTWEEYKRQYPKSELSQRAGSSEDEWRSVGDNSDGWVSGEGDKQKVRVAEYFYVETETTTLRLMSDGQTQQPFPADEVPEGWQPVMGEDGKPIERDLERPSVTWVKTNGLEVLDKKPWPGRYIPIIQVVGDVLIIPDSPDHRRYQGIVRPARDPQMGLNVMVSAEVEAIGLAPKAPWIGYVETIEGFESWWNLANVRNFPLLPVKAARDGTGQALPPPQRQIAEPPIQAIAQAIATFRESVKSATGVFDPSLGNLSPSERSGRAIIALQKQADVGTSNFLDNLARAITYEGRILVDLIPKIYNRPGRVLRMITGNDDTKAVMVNQPFVRGEDGQPQAVPPGTPQAEQFDLSQAAEFSVVVKVGKSFDTAREEMAATMGELIGASPGLLQMYGDLYFGAQDWAGAAQMAKRAKLLLPPQIQQAEGGPQPTVEQLQQQLQQMQQMFEVMTKELNAKTQAIETDQVKAQQQLQIEQLKAQVEQVKIQRDVELQKIKGSVDLQKSASEQRATFDIERMKVVADLLKTRATLEQQQTEAMIDQATAELDREVALAGAREEREAVAQEADADRAFQAAQSEREAEREREAETTPP